MGHVSLNDVRSVSIEKICSTGCKKYGKFIFDKQGRNLKRQWRRE